MTGNQASATLRQAAAAAVESMRAARSFIGIRERMHPDGQAWYDEDLNRLVAALASSAQSPASPQASPTAGAGEGQ